ncbi:SPOR domain-containing protein, partial [Roseomonas sp. 18066]|uniref:SPOR domain-containing protein n=1 Tax=Roseomonas sp. 18066 TaxID=2681412 RepID=UPI00190F9062
RAPAGGQWAVQVGAFDAAAAARTAASRAARRGGKAEVESVRASGKMLYRARVTGLSATAARQFCRGASGPCMVIAP